MAGIDETIERRARNAVSVASRYAKVVSAYLFGSHVDGTPDRWSDIDVALFIEGLENCDLHEIARISAQVQKEAGDDVELHLLPAVAITRRDAAAFSSWVMDNGVRLQ